MLMNLRAEEVSEYGEKRKDMFTAEGSVPRLVSSVSTIAL
jgi:hypothetical protein